MRRLALASLLLVGACPNPGPGGGTGECMTDADCSGNTCADTHVCVVSGDTHKVAVHWTIAGQAPTAQSCAPVGTLNLTIDDNLGDGATFSPLVCVNGLFNFEKLPNEYTEVSLMGGGGAWGQTPIPRGDTSVTIDLP